MIAAIRTSRAAALAAILSVVLGLFLAGWTWHLVDSSRFDGVPTTRVLFSYRTDTPVGEITSGVTIEQSFLSTQDYLSQVDINMATYIRENTPPVVFSLVDENGDTVRTVVAEPGAIADNQYHAFKFDPIPDSSGRRYVATLTSPEGRTGDAFTAWAGDCDCYPDGALYINGELQPTSELSMRASYTRPDVLVWRELIDRMSQYKPLLFKGAGLVLIGAIAGGLSVLAMGMLLLAALRNPAEEMRPRYLWLAVSIVAVVAVLLVTTPYSF